MDDLIAGRECGSCTLCCIMPVIDKPEIQKTSASVCRHCNGGGCNIYAARPTVCREYYCGWRRLPIFGEDWRPDLSGVFAMLENDVPPQFDAAFGISLILVGNPLKTIRQDRFVDFVTKGISKNFPLFLGLPGPKGMQCARLPLNTQDIYEASRRSRSQTKSAIEKILRRLMAHEFLPHPMEYSGNDVST